MRHRLGTDVRQLLCVVPGLQKQLRLQSRTPVKKANVINHTLSLCPCLLSFQLRREHPDPPVRSVTQRFLFLKLVKNSWDRSTAVKAHTQTHTHRSTTQENTYTHLLVLRLLLLRSQLPLLALPLPLCCLALLLLR